MLRDTCPPFPATERKAWDSNPQGPSDGLFKSVNDLSGKNDLSTNAILLVGRRMWTLLRVVLILMADLVTRELIRDTVGSFRGSDVEGQCPRTISMPPNYLKPRSSFKEDRDKRGLNRM